ncbi:hypothetical protein M8A51_22105 [Schlegelella sp. S2-27]|uniref:Alpha/beta hydrolase family protein n=1 Tax=Caldimonas mangrovi TaxID=2944811 RepID=A0ABT0YVU5_9BURK|nr:hypothetical protein [Caldimonas mangrovi]MCM5682231.1 hypothetical protein [Caldimonas mangrovi]
MPQLSWHAATLAAAVLVLAGCASTAPDTAALQEAAPAPAACPPGVPAEVRCLAGQDSAGAHYLIAMPPAWNGVLVLHAHGGPALGAPTAKRTQDDLTRWSIMVKAGYAWAGSSFRQGGVEVRAAAEDTERLRRLFVAHVAKPRRTVLHGQSWGANVAAKGAEMYTARSLGRPPYDAVLLTSGVLGGGTRSYDFRTDLRAVYQYLCGNHPRPGEPAYPLNIGLPAGVKLPRPELNARVNECLGLDKPAAQRSAEQQRKVRTLVDVIRIPESSITAHLAWGTYHFQDIVQQRTGGTSPFGNIGVRYSGSGDDAALNADVPRLRADPNAVRRLAEDTDLDGRIPVPVLTVKGIGDPTAFVELDAYFKQTMERGGSAGRLVQTYTRHDAHSYLSDPTYPTLMSALLAWVERGNKPTPAGIAAQCAKAEANFGPGCAFVPDYVPPALETRVPARERP